MDLLAAEDWRMCQRFNHRHANERREIGIGDVDPISLTPSARSIRVIRATKMLGQYERPEITVGTMPEPLRVEFAPLG